MGIWRNSAEGGTHGVLADASNTGGASEDAFTSFNHATVATFNSAAAANGGMGYSVTGVSGAIREGRVDLASPDGTGKFVGKYQRKAAATVTHTLLQLRSASALICSLIISASTQRLVLQNAQGANIFGTDDSLTAIDTWYRIELYVDPDTASTGIVEFRMYVDQGTVAQATYTPGAVNDLGIAPFSNMRIFRPSAFTADETTEWWDSLALYTDTDVPASPLPWADPPAPEVNYGYVRQGGLWVPRSRERYIRSGGVWA